MKKIIIQIIKCLPVLLLIVVLPSCKKYLDVLPPTNATSSSTVFNTKGTIDGLMSQMYFESSNMMSGVAIKDFEMIADNAYNPTASNTDAQTANLTPLTASEIVDWWGSYKAIYVANTLIEGLPTVNHSVLDETTKKSYIGAALTVRAYIHFLLVRAFGDVPLITTSNVEESRSVGRTPKDAVYAQIETDLKDAIADLPPTPGAPYYINCKYIPKSILASVYLTEGKWEEAETAASDVINSNKYQLETDLSRVFLQGSSETIMTVGYTQKYNENSPNASQWGWSLIPFQSFLESVWAALSPGLLNSFEAGDNRKTAWTKLYNASNYPDPENRVFQNKYKIPSIVDQNTSPGQAEDYKFIRLAELYLIRAEARAQQTKLTEAAKDLDRIRNRAGLLNTTAATKTDLIDAVLDERRHELFFENDFRWFDLVRTGKVNAVLSAIPYKTANWKPYMTLLPISTEIINTTPGMTQNPGY